MLARLFSSALPMRAVARRAAVPTVPDLKSPKTALLGSQTTNFVPHPNAQIKSSLTVHVAKSFSYQTRATSSAASSPPRPVEDLEKPSEGKGKLGDLSERKVGSFGEEVIEGKAKSAQEMVGRSYGWRGLVGLVRSWRRLRGVGRWC